MKTTKKILALVLALVMALSLFAGCNQTPAEDTTPKETVATGGETIDATTLFQEHVTIKFCYPDGKSAASFAEWDRIVEAVNKITKEKINATIEFEMIPLGEYGPKMQAKFQANEPWDLCFSGAWNNFAAAAGMNAYAELTMDQLNTYAPDAMKLINNAAFDATTIDGKIYGVPLQQIYARYSSVRFDKDYAKSLGFDYSKITKLEDIEPLLQAIKADGQNVAYMADTVAFQSLGSYYGFDFLAGYTVPGAVMDDDTSCTVINQFESKEFKDYVTLMKNWYDKGYWDESVLAGKDSYGNTKRHVDINGANKPGGDIAQSASEGLNILSVTIGDAVLTTGAINATTHAVSANSKNPGRVLAFINLLTSDAELLNLLMYGEEGVDWEWIAEDKNLIKKLETGYPGNHGFLVGNTFNIYCSTLEEIGVNEATAELNLNCPPSPILGFSFNSANVSTEIANINAIIGEYLQPLCAGMVDDVDAAIAELNAQLEAAGMDTVLAEMQSQVNAWKAANG